MLHVKRTLSLKFFDGFFLYLFLHFKTSEGEGRKAKRQKDASFSLTTKTNKTLLQTFLKTLLNYKCNYIFLIFFFFF